MTEEAILMAAMARRDRLRKEIVEIENWIRLYHQFAREVDWSTGKGNGKGARAATHGEHQIVPDRQDVAIRFVGDDKSKPINTDGTRAKSDRIANLTDGRDSIV